jgi:Preprotein translocase subunit SecF
VFWTALTGLPVDLGMAFVGGTEVRIDVGNIENPETQIDTLFESEQDSISSVPGTGEYIVTFASGVTSPEEVENKLNENPDMTLSQISQISPLLGGDSQKTALMGLGIAFALMSAFVFLLFRSIVPSLIVILSAVGNIAVATAAMNITGIALSMGTVGALLMLIGYGVDSDILMNTYVLREHKISFNESIHEAMRTGVTMSITSIAAMVVMTIVATLFRIELLADMGFVLAVGLTADIIITYLLNVGILRYYVTMKGDYI